jgi:hypothetical protein
MARFGLQTQRFRNNRPYGRSGWRVSAKKCHSPIRHRVPGDGGFLLVAGGEPRSFGFAQAPQAFQIMSTKEWVREEVSIGAVAASIIPYDNGLGLCIPLFVQARTFPNPI